MTGATANDHTDAARLHERIPEQHRPAPDEGLALFSVRRFDRDPYGWTAGFKVASASRASSAFCASSVRAASFVSAAL